jgi:hypothetical protein
MSTKMERPKNRRWIIGKDARRCKDYHCEGFDRTIATYTVDMENGVISTTCKLCEKTTERRCDDWKELRACENPKCGWVRDVSMRYFSGGILYNRFCDACEIENSMRRHLYQAQQLKEKAERIRAERRKKPQLKAEEEPLPQS